MKSSGSPKLYEQEYPNDTSVEQTWALKFHRDIQGSLTVSKTKMFEAARELSVKADLAGFGAFTGKVGFKEGLSATESETNSVTEGWAVDNPIRVPAHTKVTATVYVDEGEISANLGCPRAVRHVSSRCLFPRVAGAFPLVRHSAVASVAETGCRVVSSVEVSDAVGDGAG
ncbi:ETX/MTX2 family pore-forming toxin [Kitasatospora sp. NPDC057223]|uniref:ETX/MTX2 family pore-forming toxin n=1 Tax=Kitasatospora sp. NPDC057223 TaxID=3346055 RepID=UPI0036365DAE